ncbi:MAG TPA: NmrA family NAD(P)-binding protein [Bryobacteraceae bacterium]|nr:NmrA family NAD(P)-binding protein [Bryobacteraceae bacterium]
MKLGITGAAGQMGAALLRDTLARVPASSVVAVTRSPEKLERLSTQGVEVRAGDFNQPASLEAAFRGIERLVIVPTPDLQPGLRRQQQSAAIRAAVAAGVRHVIYISTVSARPDPNNELFDSHFATEQALIQSGARWTILRMSIYMDTLLDPAKRALASGSYAAVPGAPAAYVLREDIAAAAAGILAAPGHEGITYHATGPVSVTQEQIAEAVSQAAGKKISFSPMSEAQQRAGLEAAGLPPFILNAILGFQATLRAGAFDLVTADVARLAGRPASSPAEFFARALAASGGARA